ncbi:hypothetical protein [Ereboglobus luteus]|uniref:Beta-xylosidase C-terminal Concanavalin A-like domain-containing protein n=1 Tax=Ereboglobus luteus TaxID=1796921 RepID=A0A2U8E481_9BACT|nr:hypothetical protein [Ereboglobus luteus]AWI09332.1 hypothetical protein CKA38_08840 [Ereboglobus luteus]
MNLPKNRRVLPRIHALAVLAAGVFTLSAVHAALPVVSDGETVVFSEDFADNSNKWTSVAGEPVVKHALIADSFWGPSIISDGKDVASNAYLPKIVDLADGPISVYFRVRTENPRGTDGSRFEITLRESTGNHLVTLSLRPALPVGIAYRDPAGKGTRTNVGSTSRLFKKPGALVSFKLVVTPGKDRFPATAEVFYYDETKAVYTSLGKAADVVNLTTGKFNRLSIFSRNGEKGATWFDSVAVAQAAK